MKERLKARVIAFYLPQYHPIRQNDEWWGKGFTEWTNVTKAKPLFPGHYQPRLPADLGFYDLRVPEVREAQAQMARQYGVEAFCYYHYWLGGGHRLLERPFHEVLQSGKPDFPFCLCWANETWTGVWHGEPKRVLAEQTYPGKEDEERHFQALLPAFQDKRYVKVDGKPMFVVYSPHQLPDPVSFTSLWRKLAMRSGLPGIYFVGYADRSWEPAPNGFDAVNVRNLHSAQDSESNPWLRKLKTAKRKFFRHPIRIYSYENAIECFIMDEWRKTNVYPCVIPNWDNTARSGSRGLVLHGSTPELFRRHLRAALDRIRHKPSEHRIVFVKSWNEWAEGNYLEPDRVFGTQYLEALKAELLEENSGHG